MLFLFCFSFCFFFVTGSCGGGREKGGEKGGEKEEIDFMIFLSPFWREREERERYRNFVSCFFLKKKSYKIYVYIYT